MPRARRLPYIKSTKENFSCPAYIAVAAKLAAGHPEKDFSPWVVSAIEAKLQRENPGLKEATLEDLRKRAASYQERIANSDKVAAEEPPNIGPWAPGESPREKILLNPVVPAEVKARAELARRDAQQPKPRPKKTSAAGRK